MPEMAVCVPKMAEIAISGRAPILNAVLVCPLNRKNKGCVEAS